VLSLHVLHRKASRFLRRPRLTTGAFWDANLMWPRGADGTDCGEATSEKQLFWMEDTDRCTIRRECREGSDAWYEEEENDGDDESGEMTGNRKGRVVGWVLPY
jgi:hypothetical protein